MTLYVFGSNEGSQLAHEDHDDTFKPLTIDFFKNKRIDKIAAGSLHTLILCENKIYSFGCNDEFALGREGPEHEIKQIITKLPENTIITQISTGSSHSAFLTNKGTVYCWGTFRDKTGIIGYNSSTKFQKTPKFLRRGVCKISSSYNVLTMTTKNGGIIQHGACMFSSRLVKNERKCLSRKIKNEPRIMVRPSHNHKEILDIVSGGDHKLFLYKDGTVKAFGNNYCGQFGNNTKECSNYLKDVFIDNKVVKVAAGIMHSLFLTDTCDLYGCGENNYGQLGIPQKEVLVPVKIAENVIDIAANGFVSFLRRNDGVYAAGTNFFGESGHDFDKYNTLKEFSKIDFDFGDILSIHAGDRHTLVLSK